MILQQLPPEIIYHILNFLPSADITTMAYFYCRTIREWSLVLMNERAQQSMLQGWRLMLGATIIKTETDYSETKSEADTEYVYAFDYIDPSTLDMYFSVGAFGNDGFGSLVNSTAPSTSVPTASPPPEQQQGQRKPDQPCIPMPFGNTTTTIQVSILKEKVPTKLLEFAATLTDSYSFLVSADYYQSLRPNYGISLTANIHPQFTINYHIQKLTLTDYHNTEISMRAAPVSPHQQQQALEEERTETPITPPSPPSQHRSTAASKPGIALRIESLKVSPKWWWARIDHQHYSTFHGLEHQYW